MPYTANPYMPKVRRLAVNDVKIRGMSQTAVARKYGVTRSAVCKWLKKASNDHRVFIETKPSRPKNHPQQIKPEVIERIIHWRKKTGRCAPVVHAYLEREGVTVSLSSVERVIKRLGLTRKKKPAKWDTKVERPVSHHPGALVQVDTIHFVRPDYSRFYVYALIDTFSRMGYASYAQQITQDHSLAVVYKARKYFGFPFEVIQTDNGPEFKTKFRVNLQQSNMKLRHSRVRKPNDNAHVERFNRTIQEECFRSLYPDETKIDRQLKSFVTYYNRKRLHLSLNCLTPAQFVSKVVN